MTKKPHDMPEDFVPSLEFASKRGMWESTYNFESEAFKNHHLSRANTGKIHDWNCAWKTWVLNWVRGSFSKSPMQQHGAPDLPKGFKLTKDTHMQNTAWLHWHRRQEKPSKWAISEIEKAMNGFGAFIVPEEYPPTHGSVVQLDIYRSAG